MLIKNASCVMASNVLERDIRIEGGKICDIATEITPKANEEIYDATGMKLFAGFIDTHTHGAVGHFYSNFGVDFQAICEFEAREGVTTIAVTHTSMQIDDFESVCKEVLPLINNTRGAKIGGFHSEGPFMNLNKKGAMNPKRIISPSVEIFDRMYEATQGQMKLMTLAPENDGALDVIKRAVSKGVQITAGHTEATYEQMQRAIDAGVTRMTHTFNACRALNHREPGVLGAALTDDRIVCEVICDFGHLHPAIVELIYKLKGSSHFCAISDSEFAAGLAEGVYESEGISRYIDTKMGVCRLEDGTICGSASSLYRGFKNLVSMGIPLWEVSEMVSANPAKALGIYDKTGSISVGKAADLVFVNDKYEIVRVLVDGKDAK